jgi:hypothetical protein
VLEYLESHVDDSVESSCILDTDRNFLLFYYAQRIYDMRVRDTSIKVLSIIKQFGYHLPRYMNFLITGFSFIWVLLQMDCVSAVILEISESLFSKTC